MAKATRTLGKNIEAAERNVVVVRLRKAGYSYAEIGEQVKLSKGQISKILNKYLDDFARAHKDELEELRNTENARLDGYLKQVHSKAIGGNMGAIDRAVRIMDRRAKLLGLDAPAKIAPTDPNGDEPYSGGGMAALAEAIRAADEQSGKKT